MLLPEACTFPILPLFGEKRRCKVVHSFRVFLGLPHSHHLLCCCSPPMRNWSRASHASILPLPCPPKSCLDQTLLVGAHQPPEKEPKCRRQRVGEEEKKRRWGRTSLCWLLMSTFTSCLRWSPAARPRTYFIGSPAGLSTFQAQLQLDSFRPTEERYHSRVTRLNSSTAEKATCDSWTTKSRWTSKDYWRAASIHSSRHSRAWASPKHFLQQHNETKISTITGRKTTISCKNEENSGAAELAPKNNASHSC